MKILIVATPRSGSTTLTNVLGRVYNCKVYREPFRKEYKGQSYDSNKSHILKVMIDQIDINSFNFSIYDRIIYLSRKNLIEASQSFDYQLKHNLENSEKWDQPYVLRKSNTPTDSFNFLKKSFNDLENLADFIVYYEDLYSRDKDVVRKIIDRLELNLNFNSFFTLLNQKQRYRKYKQELI